MSGARRSTWIAGALVAITAAYVLSPVWGAASRDEFQLVVWGMPFEDRLFEDGYARDFEVRHPGLEVRYDRYPDPIRKYYAWHLRGHGADVMRLNSDQYHRMVARGLLEPLDRFLDDPETGIPESERADYPPSVWERLEIDGSRYALPSDHNLYGLFWNRAMFAAKGVEPPDESWTWDDLRAAAAALEEVDAEGKVVVHGIDFWLFHWPFYAFLRQAGGTTWDADELTTGIDSPEGEAALDFVVQLIGRAPSVRSASGAASATGPEALFASGRTAMLLDGSWRVPSLELTAPELDFGVSVLPRGPGPDGRAAMIGTSVLWAVSVHSEDKDRAWDMIRWMTNREQSLRYWDTLRVAPPARLSVIASSEFRSTPGITDPATGDVLVPPMPGERFERRARWLLDGLVPDPGDPAGGVPARPAPAFLEAAPYQPDLDRAVRRMLARAVSPSRTETSAELLAEAAAQVHAVIDRDRATRGLPPVDR